LWTGAGSVAELKLPNTIQKPGFSASNKPCQANIRSNFGKFNSSHTKNLVSWLRFDRMYGVTKLPIKSSLKRQPGQIDVQYQDIQNYKPNSYIGNIMTNQQQFHENGKTPMKSSEPAAETGQAGSKGMIPVTVADSSDGAAKGRVASKGQHAISHFEDVVEQPTVDGAEIIHSDPRSLRRRVMDLAWPVIGENFLETFLHIVDTLLVAQLGAAAIAGVGAAIQVMFFVFAALSALSIGSAVLVAQAFGARDFKRAGELAGQSLLWSVVFSVPMAIGGVLLAGPVVGLFGLEPEVTRIGVDYLRVTMGTVVVLTCLFIGSGVLRGIGDSRTPMILTAIANVVNVGLAYGLIFGHFGLPALGAVGSAWGTFLARAFILALMVWILWRGRNEVSIKALKRWRPDLKIARQVLDIGIPAATEQFLISAAFLMLTMIVAGLGTVTLAAHRVAMNALSISFLPGIGFAIAATALVGQSVGARRLDEGAAAARIATTWGTLWMGAVGLVIFFFAPQIMSLFTDEADMIAVGATGLQVVALAQPFWAVLFVQSGALRGLGNTRFPLRVNATGIWLAVGLAYLLIEYIGGELNAVWGAFLIVSPGMAAILWWRFRQTIQV
jgi:putative MATE family efflux protein